MSSAPARPTPPSAVWRRPAAWMLAAALAALTAQPPARAESADAAKRRAQERTDFTDAEIVDGFFKIALSAEFHTGGTVDRIRKYDGPVRVFIDNRARPDRRRQVEAAVADIGARVRHLDIAMAPSREQANVTVTLVRDRDLTRTLRAIYGRERARRIQRSLDPQCLSSFRKDDSFRIVGSEVILAVDIDDFTFEQCVYEELLQALGPINDDPSVPWTMFNDDVQLGYFGIYDQYLLNILYHPGIRPGMTRDAVSAALPGVLRDVRPWVAEINKLPR